jgi:hypothetical protein
VRRSYIAWSAVGVLIVGAVVVVDVERVRQWGHGAPEAVGFRGEVGGTVRSLDAKTHVVRVARGMLDYSAIPISVTNDTRVNVSGRLGAFGDLREGLSLSVCYEVKPSGRWARSIEMPPSPAPCGAVADAASPEPPGDDLPVGSRREEPPARARALETATETPRRPKPATRSSEDYAALIGRVLTERAESARQSATESALARPERNPRTESAAAVTFRESTMPSPVNDAPGETAPPPSTAAIAPSAPGESPQPVVPEVAAPVVAPEHRSGEAVVARPTCNGIAEALHHDSSVDGRSRKQRLVDCVGGWLKGEAQEVRDGFKRGIEEFRAEVENVSRGLQRLGEKLRR